MKNNLNNYVEWLKDQNISERTIELYTQSLQKFTNNLTTDEIRNYLKECLLKCEVSTVKIYRQALSSYARYKKLDIDWTKVNGILPNFTQGSREILHHFKSARIIIVEKD